MPIFAICFSESQVLDRDRIARDIADLEAIKADLAPLVSLEQAAFLMDRRNLFALRYLIIQAVEAMADLCQHILARTRGIPCEGYVDCILKAGEHGIISLALSERLRQLASLRNMLVHRYWRVDDARLYVETRASLSDLKTFVQEIETFIQGIS
jgi:uncharacterized protein YutE (UPF0331/DUF86 family)